MFSLLLFYQIKGMRGWGKDKEGNGITYMVTEGDRYTDVVLLSCTPKLI